MGFLKNLFSSLSATQIDDAFYFYVQCDKCGEKLRIRVDKHHDLMPDYEGGSELHKEILGKQCNQLIYAQIKFDGQQNVISKEITGGKYISAEDFGTE